MPIIKLRRNTKARRNMTVNKTPEFIAKKPTFRSLLMPKTRTNGRNNTGKITVRHRGGGAKSKLRLVNFKYSNIQYFDVIAFEYDPGRTGYIAAAKTDQNQAIYVLYVEGMKVGNRYFVGEKTDIAVGNRCQMKNIPVGEFVSAVELNIGGGAVAVRGAGSKAQIMARDGNFVMLKMPSGEVRKIDSRCYATIGGISNSEHNIERIGSAGRKRLMGIRPTVRGKVMNPVDHPHGGGEGNQSIGMKHPKTPWGKAALGVKTRKNKRTNNMIVKDRRVRK